ncbi:hypothetical protein SDJN02_16370, partial [Cucurbita argyrosperma subsp. argyrosperma]
MTYGLTIKNQLLAVDGDLNVCSFVRLAMRNCVSLDVHLNGGQKKFAHCDLWISLICLIFFMKNSMGMEEGYKQA